MKPHPDYRRAWIVLHAFGLFGTLALQLLGLEELVAWFASAYVAGVAALEAWSVVRIVLGRTGDGTMSWTTWGFLEAGTGRRAFWRYVVVGVWFLAFVVVIWLYLPVPTWFKAASTGLGGLWLWPHLFGRRASSHPPRTAGPYSRPGDGGGRHPRQH